MKYPRISERNKMRPGGLCALCDQPLADMKLIVQIDNMRGNDDVVKVHRACVYRKTSDALLEQLSKRGAISVERKVNHGLRYPHAH